MEAPRSEPIRQCLVTGEKCPKSTLLRFVGVAGVAVPDIQGRLPGRGYWLKPERAVLELAIKQRAFQKRSRGALKAEAGLVERVEAALRDAGRVLDTSRP
jgi:predicted RNA-binding protein YlxR (DUF448 family)